MFTIDGYQSGLRYTKLGRRLVQQDVGLSAVKLAENVGGGDEVAIAVDEETVAEEKIVIAAIGGGLIDWINDGADRVEQLFVIRDWRCLARCGDREPHNSKSPHNPTQDFSVCFHWRFENAGIATRRTLLSNLN